MVDIDEVERIARLARLEFGGEEKERLIGEFNNILKFVDRLKEVDAEGAEENSFENYSILREDRIEPSLDREKIMVNVPDFKGGLIKVSKMMGDE